LNAMNIAFCLRVGCLFVLAVAPVVAAEQPESPYVDLRTVMRLAGANNDEIELARVRHEQAIAESKQAWQRFWPTLSLGAGYRGHEGNVQDIAGAVFDARKQQYTVGANVMIDWSPGDLYYQALVAKQRAVAAEQLAEKSRQDILLEAVERYYDLLAAEADVAVIEEDLKVVRDYAGQLEGAVTAGTAFKADLLRVQTQISRVRLLVRQGQEARDLRAAALAETLRLAPETALRPAKADLVPVALMLTGGSSASLVAKAVTQRAEVAATDAASAAAALEDKRSRVAPLVPSVQAGYVGGGLGGGFAGDWGNFGDQQDFFVGLGWKIGPGGLFDRQRRKIAEAQVQSAALQGEQVKASIGREVVEANARVKSAKDQISIADEAVTAAQEMAQLAKERQASQLGVVLEYLLAREDLTRAKRDRVTAVAGYNKAQHALVRAVGGLGRVEAGTGK
jgi:outer membrane protein TolC